MEIINYSGKKGGINSMAVGGFLSKPAKYNARSASVGFGSRALVGASRGVSLKDVILDARGNALLLGRQVKSALKYTLIIPAVVVSVAVPYTIVKNVTYEESFARPLPLEQNVAREVALLDDMMANFALGSSYFDAEGNVLEDDGELVLPVVSVREPVTFQRYTVQAGDTISGVCQKFGLTNISTLIAVNNIGNVRYLRSGQKLRIPSVDGLIHTVAKKETLGGISSRYGVSVEDLLDVNDLDSEALYAGQELFIPGAKMDSDSLQKAMGEMFAVPLKDKWRLTSTFGKRPNPFTGEPGSNHGGIDMACPTGTSIYAAMSGTVVFTGRSAVYGNYVIIKHIDGYQTLYAHMSKILTTKGTFVGQGDRIGLVGSTGQSTGPHLHFTVYKDGKRIDPLTVLKITK